MSEHAPSGLARPVHALDVRHLPKLAGETGYVGWWATTAFMVAEGTTLAACAVAYLYLRTSNAEWPPAGTPLPDVVVPTINMLVLLVTIVPMTVAGKAAARFDLRRVRLGLVLGALLSAVSVVLRGFEFAALRVRWDESAYGSATWAVLGFHTTLLVVDFLETLVFAVLVHVATLEEKHYSDVEDAAYYQWFLSLAYVPLWFLVIIAPRWL